MKKDIHTVFKILQEHIPLRTKVILRIAHLSENHGDCTPPEDDDDPIVIHVDKTSCLSTQEETVVHEYAHAMRYDKGDYNYGHSDKWGKAYARAYRVFERYYLIK